MLHLALNHTHNVFNRFVVDWLLMLVCIGFASFGIIIIMIIMFCRMFAINKLLQHTKG